MSTSSAAANRALYVGLGLGATMLTGALSYLYYKYLKRDVMPLKWRRVGTLEEINLFPIKSCAPLKFSPEDELLCEILGLRYKGIRDRALMLVNEKYEMITARVYPKLVLVFTKIVGETKLIMTAEGMEPLELDFATLVDEAPGKDIHTSVWGTKLDAMLCGEKYDKWFSRYILNKDSGLHLVYYPYPKPVRSVNSRLTKEPFITKEDSEKCENFKYFTSYPKKYGLFNDLSKGTFNDATSYMLMNLASVDDLNTRLPNPVDPLQFRGNFHLKMDKNEAYAEDNWQWIRIGEEAVFRKVAPCTRCILPNINVNTGERDPQGNPLKELKSYRLINDKVSPTLGIHLGLRQAGSIKPNDIIYVEDFE